MTQQINGRPLQERPRCTAKSKRTGEQCNNAPMRGSSTCRMHGSATKASRSKAQERILEAADPAAANLVKWMNNKKVDMRLRVQIAQDLLNRAGLTSKQVLEVEVSTTFEEMVAGAVVSVSEGTEVADLQEYADRVDVVDAEVVDDQQADAPPASRLPASSPREHRPYHES